MLLGWGSKILLALLILSFGVWGIGDYVSPQQGKDIVANVGESVITLDEFRNEVQFQVSQLQSVLGNNFTAQKAKAMGITSNVLNSLIQRKIFSEGAKKMGLIISDDLVAQNIRNDVRFKSKGGGFDRLIFNETLQRAGLNEPGYISLYRGQIIQNQLLSGINNGQVVPRLLVNSLYKFRNEKRSMNIIKIKHSTFRDIPEASDSDLQKFHKKYAQQFTAPEYRAITLVQLQIKDIVGEINVSNREIQDSYNDRINEFKIPETRKIQQILVSNKIKSDEIYKKISEGNDFIKVAKNLANLDPKLVNIGTLARNQIPIRKVADTAFSLFQNGISKPIKSPLGWHILRVTKIKPAKQKMLSEVSNKLKKIIAEEKAVEVLYNLSNKFEDELGSGSSIAEAANRLNFKIRNIPALNAEGYDIANKKLSDLNPKIIQVAFNTEQDQDSALIDLGDTGYFILHVNSITPPLLKPFETIRTEVEKSWRLNQQAIAAEKKVRALIKRIKGGTKLTGIAVELKTKVEKSSEFLRTGAGLKMQVPGQLISSLFAAKNSEVVSASSNSNSFIAQIRTIKIANLDTNKKNFGAFKKRLLENIKNDISTQYSNALRKNLGVKIDNSAVESVF